MQAGSRASSGRRSWQWRARGCLAPAGVGAQQALPDGVGRTFKRQVAVGPHHHGACARHLGVEPARQGASVRTVGQAGEIAHQRGVGRRRWCIPSVPAVQGTHGAGQCVGHFGVLHRALQQRGNGHQQREQQEHQQGQREAERPPFAPHFGAGQGFAQRAGGMAVLCAVRGPIRGVHGDHAGVGLHGGGLCLLLVWAHGSGGRAQAYCVAQAAKRFSSASPWSAQKPTLNCRASLALVAEVGRSSSTFLSSDARALVLAGP